jgi:hypothetical protein
MSDINVQTFSGKVNISNNLKVGSNHLFVDTLNNQVGLNTNNPTANLHVNGNTYVHEDLRVGSKVTIDSDALDSNVIVVTGGNIKADFLHGDGSNIANISADNIDGTLSQWTGAVGSSIYYAENVGIGLTNPQFKLDVNGDANVGVLTATFLGGDGSNITNIVSSQWEGDPGNPIYYDGNVGIATSTAPTRTLEVGSNLYVEDAGSNVLTVDGNIAATNITIGDVTIVASQGLDHVTNENNTTTQVVQFNHPTTGFVTAANAVIGGTLSLQNFALSQSYGLENVTDVNNTTGYTIVSSNATTGFQSTANVSVGRDALVTGNVTVGKDLTVSEEATFSSNVTIDKDLEVSGNVTNLDVLSNVNLLSVSNVVSIKKDSNVVTEFPRSKKLIKYPRVALNADSQDGYAVTSYEGTTSGAENYNVFNGIKTGTDRWSPSGPAYTSGSWNNTQSNGTTQDVNGTIWTGEWLQIQLPNKIALKSHIIQSRSTHTHRMVKKGVILGSNTNGTTWNLVDSWSGLNSGSEREVSIDSINYYDYYRLVSIELETGNSDAVRTDIQEWELYGLPEYDPEAHGTDVVVKSVPNVPNTDWLEVYYDAKEPSSYPGTGGTVVDLSGNSRNGVLDGVTFDSASNSFVFDGVDDKIDSGPMTFTPTSSYSVSTWVKVPEVTSTQDLLFQFGHGTTGEAFGMNYGRDGQISTYIFSGQTRFTPNNLYDANEWVHVTGIWYNDGTMQIYANGSRVDNSTSGNLVALSIPSNPYLTIGIHFGGEQTSYYTGAFFKGSITNFRLFNRALTSDEVWQLYAYQKEYFGHGDLGMTLKAGRLGIGTSEPRAALDVRGDVHISGTLRKTKARMIRLESSSVGPTTQAGWQTYVSYGETWTAYSSDPLYSVSITGDFVNVARAITYRIAVQNQRTGEVMYFPTSSGWTKYHYYDYTRLDGHGYLGIMSGLIPGDSYKVQLEVDPKNTNTGYEWNSAYGTITGLVWD